MLILGSATPLLAARPDYLPYDKFIAEVEAGTVKTVSLDRFSRITGTYTVDGAERPFSSYGDTGSANDILLNRLLQQKNVAVTLEKQEERNPFWQSGLIGLVMFVIPLITLLLVLRINSKLNRLRQ